MSPIWTPNRQDMFRVRLVCGAHAKLCTNKPAHRRLLPDPGPVAPAAPAGVPAGVSAGVRE